MKKALSLFLCLLFLALSLLGCQPQKQEEPPEVEPGHTPLSIEQGEIIVSEIWQDTAPPQNPCSDELEGTPLRFEQLSFHHISYDGALYNSDLTLLTANSLTEAAAVIDRYDTPTEFAPGYFAQAPLEEIAPALCEQLSHVDFEQFCLLFIFERYGSSSEVGGSRLDALLQTGTGDLTAVLYHYEHYGEMLDDLAMALRCVLVRKADLLCAPTHVNRHIYYDPPNTIEQGEIVVSELWQDTTPPQSPFPGDGYGTPLKFEEIALARTEFGRFSNFLLITDREKAAVCIDRSTTYNSVGCLTLNEAVSHVDFEEFYVLALFEDHADASCPGASPPVSLLLQGDSQLCVVYRSDPSGQLVHADGSLDFVRLLLVRQSDIPAHITTLTFQYIS